ncbi:small ribosomal subunit protein uS7m-like [Artemia franciscana]|uniref:Small ribosomal subunit protein uS7 domain-containing protein n=1 Tax=Artemia franciscana TaxID=6661 RepID=A0AA88HI97_ARTSF|nr:hypothetical protein QYM36_016252 [Artemia franciscana]
MSSLYIKVLGNGISKSLVAKERSKIIVLRSYSRYAPFYEEAITDHEELEKINQGQRPKPIGVKAAESDQTSLLFYDETLRKFTNYVMREGMKETAQHLMNRTFMKIKQIQLTKFLDAQTQEEREAIELNPLTVFHRAVRNCTPILELTPIKRGGQTYQVPVAVTEKKANFIAMNWLIDAGKDKDRTKRFYDQLATELVNAYNGEGRVVRRKIDLHKQCEANKAYAHYRWG